MVFTHTKLPPVPSPHIPQSLPIPQPVHLFETKKNNTPGQYKNDPQLKCEIKTAKKKRKKAKKKRNESHKDEAANKHT